MFVSSLSGAHYPEQEPLLEWQASSYSSCQKKADHALTFSWTFLNLKCEETLQSTEKQESR